MEPLLNLGVDVTDKNVNRLWMETQIEELLDGRERVSVTNAANVWEENIALLRNADINSFGSHEVGVFTNKFF